MQTQADLAIQTFETNYKCSDVFLQEDPFNFPHWNDIFSKITDVWQSKFESHVNICSKLSETSDLLVKLRTDTVKIFSKKADYQTYKKYYNHLIDYFIAHLSSELANMFSEDLKENNVKNLPILKVNLNRFNVKKLENGTLKSTEQKINEERIGNQLNALHLLRCHSNKNNPNDNESEVSNAAFELASLRSLKEPQKYTNIFATCGSNIVNFINAETGKVIKRFTDDFHIKHKKEVYTRLSWTLLNGNCSALAVSGKLGQLIVILPHKNACIARVNAHDSEINVLLFHCTFPNILLTASNDMTIKVWEINLKDSETTIECECSCKLLKTIELSSTTKDRKTEKILSMVFIFDDYLLISTEFDTYCVCLNGFYLFNIRQEISNESNLNIVDYITSESDDIKKNLIAEKITTYGVTENEKIEFEDNVVINKLFYTDDLVLATTVDSNMIYVYEIIKTEAEKLKLRVKNHIKIKNITLENNQDTQNVLFKTSDQRYCLINPTRNGIFYSILLSKDLTSFKAAIKYTIPTNYVIKNQKDNYKIPVADFNLLDKSIVTTCITNEFYTVSTTNQNMIVIWN